MKWVKWLGVAAVLAFSVVLVGIAYVYAASSKRIHRRYDVPAAWVTAATDSVALARGRHLVTAVAKCVDCHSEDLSGSVFFSSFPMGIFVAPNLTRGQGGVGAAYSDQDWARAIQHGVRRDGTPLAFMPADAYIALSDSDLAAVIGYVKSVRAADRTWPAPRYGPLVRLLMVTGAMPLYEADRIEHQERHPVGPEPGVTPEYGRYLARVSGCPSCHNPSLSGGDAPVPDSPPARNLTPTGLAGWTEANFFTVLREGKRPDGTALDERYMPWQNAGRMTDDEIRAVWAYLRSLPPREMGQR